MKINSMNLLLNLLGNEANFYLNKVLLYKLGLEESFFITYLLDQFKLLKNEDKLREDLSFYASNSSISIYTTISEFRISELKKSAIEKGIIKISQEGIPTKTYYYINFDKLLEIVSTDKSMMELAYEYAKINNYKNEIETSIDSLEDVENLQKQSVKSLRFICKENNISYTGNDRKNILINKIVKVVNPNIFEKLNLSNTNFITVDDISSTSEQKNCPLVVSKTDTNQVLIKPNTNTCHVHVRDCEIENLLKSFDINYTDANVESINLILEKLNGDKELLKEYIVSFYEEITRNSYAIKDIKAFFSSRLKTPNEFLIKKLISKKNLEIEKIKKEEEVQKQTELIEEKRRIDEQEKIEIDLFIQKFKKLSLEKQEIILNKAEKNKLNKNPEMAESLSLFKENSKNVYRNMLLNEIREVMKELKG